MVTKTAFAYSEKRRRLATAIQTLFMKFATAKKLQTTAQAMNGRTVALFGAKTLYASLMRKLKTSANGKEFKKKR